MIIVLMIVLTVVVVVIVFVTPHTRYMLGTYDTVGQSRVPQSDTPPQLSLPGKLDLILQLSLKTLRGEKSGCFAPRLMRYIVGPSLLPSVIPKAAA